MWVCVVLVVNPKLCVFVCVCVCFNLGCSNAELLSLHRSSSHTWCFWGCRWRLSTSFSVPHPPNHLTWFSLCVFFFCSLLVAVHHLPHFTSPFLSSSISWFLICFVFLRSAPGCRALQWNRMFPPVQLPVYNHSAGFISVSLSSLFSCVPPPQGCQHALLRFMSIMLFFTPKCHLQCHLTHHRINLQGCLVRKCHACVSCVNVSEWMIRRMTSFVDECWVCANLF